MLSYEAELEALRMLVDRREELTRARVQAVNRLHRLLAELIAGQAKKDITTGQAKVILAGVRPRDLVGRTRRRLAAGQLAELVSGDTAQGTKNATPAPRRTLEVQVPMGTPGPTSSCPTERLTLGSWFTRSGAAGGSNPQGC